MSWKEFHNQEIQKEYYKILQKKIPENIFPPKEFIFRCFDETPLDKVRVIILGQDPYHGKGQANGLAFAVNEGVTIPPSLRNIIKESGCTDTTLIKWAKQGVLLLNTTLTVLESKPMSCANIGWSIYTDNAIKYLLEHTKNSLIFCLWGAHAQGKKEILKQYENVLILESSHPSPLSANKTNNPFIGCGHFKKINQILKSNDQSIIEW